MSHLETESEIVESSIIVAAKEQISSALGDEVVILEIKTVIYRALKAMGTRVWNLIEEFIAVTDTQQTLLQESEVQPNCHDLLGLLHNLKAVGLIEVKNETQG